MENRNLKESPPNLQREQGTIASRLLEIMLLPRGSTDAGHLVLRVLPRVFRRWIAESRFGKHHRLLAGVLFHIPLEEPAHLSHGHRSGAPVEIVKRSGTLLASRVGLGRRSSEILRASGQAAAQSREGFEQGELLAHRHVVIYPLTALQKLGDVLLARRLHVG